MYNHLIHGVKQLGLLYGTVNDLTSIRSYKFSHENGTSLTFGFIKRWLIMTFTNEKQLYNV